MQLRCGGVIEAVRMCRESYPSRYTHEDFFGTFNCLCSGVTGADVRQRGIYTQTCLWYIDTYMNAHVRQQGIYTHTYL